MHAKTSLFPVVCLLALLLTGCGREKIAETYPNGKPKVIRTYGWFGGETKENLKREQAFYFNGNKETDTRYRGGLRHGQYHDYWHNGQKKTEGRFAQGKKEGEWDFFYNQFSISAKGVFKNDLKEGVWRQYWESGEPRAEGSFRNGKEIGTQKEWDAKGGPAVENSCFEANEHGRYRTFYANKAVKEDYACRLGIPTGPYERKDPDGASLEKGAFDGKGRKIGPWETFHPDGKRASLIHYREGQESDSSFAWDTTGRVRERGFFTAGTGERLSYDSLGRLIEKQRFAQGRPEGESWAYYPNGAQRSLVTYKDGQPTAVRKWHPDGKLMLEGAYLAGKRAGEWKKYGENGRLSEVSHYQDDALHGEQIFYDAQGRLTRTLRYEHGYPAEGKIPAAIAAGLDKKPGKDAGEGSIGKKDSSAGKTEGIQIQDSHP